MATSTIGRSCTKVSGSVLASWWASPTGWSRFSGRASRRRSTARARFPRRSRGSTARWRRRPPSWRVFVSGSRRSSGTPAAEIFQIHLQIVNDPELLAKVHALIEEQHLTALSALQVVMQEYAAQFARIEQDYFRERLTDVRDVISRIGSHLTRKTEPSVATARPSRTTATSRSILVAHEILPSQAMSLGDLPIAGIVTEIGGQHQPRRDPGPEPGHPGRLGRRGDHERRRSAAT